MECGQGHEIGKIPLFVIGAEALAQIGQLVLHPGDGGGIVDLSVHIHVLLPGVHIEGVDEHHLGVLGAQSVLQKQQGSIQLLPVAAVIIGPDAVLIIHGHGVQAQPHMAGAKAHNLHGIFRQGVEGLNGGHRGIRIHRPQQGIQPGNAQSHQNQNGQAAQNVSFLHGRPPRTGNR